MIKQNKVGTCPLCNNDFVYISCDKVTVDTKICQIVDYDKTAQEHYPFCNKCEVFFI